MTGQYAQLVTRSFRRESINEESDGLLICFIGVDGSGKTTHAINLCKKLQKNGLNFSYIHISFSIIQHIPSRFRKPLSKQINAMTENPSYSKTRKGLVLLFLGIALADSLIIYLTKLRETILIYDRYFYDYLVDYFDVCPEWLKRLYIRLIPKPDLLFFLDVPPTIAYKRNREYPPSFYHSQRRRYFDLLRYLENYNLFIIDTSTSIEEAFSHIYEQVKGYI
ncbi:MAG: hypothetical protein QW201_01820 [Thermoproteota archaeon]